jgi:hypothetical protein
LRKRGQRESHRKYEDSSLSCKITAPILISPQYYYNLILPLLATSVAMRILT